MTANLLSSPTSGAPLRSSQATPAIPPSSRCQEVHSGYCVYHQFLTASDPTVFTFRASIPPRPTKPSEEPTTLFGLPTDFKSDPTSSVSQNQYCSFSEFTSDAPTSDASGDDENVFSPIADPEDPEEEDVWLDPDSAVLPKKPRVLTWDSFLIPGANNPENPYLTEAGPLVLDAAIEEYSGEEAGVVIRSDVFCTVRLTGFNESATDGDSACCIWGWGEARFYSHTIG